MSHTSLYRTSPFSILSAIVRYVASSSPINILLNEGNLIKRDIRSRNRKNNDFRELTRFLNESSFILFIIDGKQIRINNEGLGCVSTKYLRLLMSSQWHLELSSSLHFNVLERRQVLSGSGMTHVRLVSTLNTIRK